MMYAKDKSDVSIYATAILLRYLHYFIASMYAIALPIIIVSFSMNSIYAKLTVSAYFLGTTITMFLSGLFIELFGGGTFLIFSLLLIIIGSFICIFHVNIEWLFIGRILQAAGAGVLPVIARMILAFEDKAKRVRAFSIARSFFVWADSIAFLIAGYLLYFFNWQSIFVFLLIITALLLLYSFSFFSTHKIERQTHTPFKKYVYFFKDTRVLAVLMAYGLYYALINVYYVQSSLLFYQKFHLVPHDIAWLMITVVIFQAVGALLSLFWMNFVDSKIILKTALTISMLGALLFTCALFFPAGVYSVTIAAALILFGTGMAFAEFNSVAIHLFKRESMAIGSALLSGFPSLFTFIITGILAATDHHRLHSLAFTLLICVSLCIVLLLWAKPYQYTQST